MIVEEEKSLEESIRDLSLKSPTKPCTDEIERNPYLSGRKITMNQAKIEDKGKFTGTVKKIRSIKEKLALKQVPKEHKTIEGSRPPSQEKKLKQLQKPQVYVSIEQVPSNHKTLESSRNQSPGLASKTMNSVKRNLVNTKTVQNILEGINLNHNKLDEFIKSQGFKPVREAAAKLTSGLLSKKPSTPVLGSSELSARDKSRKSSTSRSKCSSPMHVQSQTEPPKTKKGESDNGHSLNIHIENKDFIAKLMNINIIKIKPDLQNNQCYCQNRSEKSIDKKPITKIHFNVSKEIKSRAVSNDSKSTRKKGLSPRINEMTSSRKNFKSKKVSDESPAKFLRKQSEKLEILKNDLAKMNQTDYPKQKGNRRETGLSTADPVHQTLNSNGSPRQKLFSLINEIHEQTEQKESSSTRFSTLIKRPAIHSGNKLDMRPSSQLGKLSQSQNSHLKISYGALSNRQRNSKG